MAKLSASRSVCFRLLTAGLGLLGLAAGIVHAQEPQSQPATRIAVDAQRVADLLALIEGNNSAQVRRTGAAELLRVGWPEGPSRLSAILSTGEAASKLAVAAALAELPQFLDAAYLEPLMALLADEDADTRRAAAGALAGYRDNGVVPRLRSLAANPEAGLTARLAAVDSLGLMPQRAAVAALIELLQDETSPVCQPALAAIEQTTAMDFDHSPRAALEWWRSGSRARPEDWQQEQIERLVTRSREHSRRQRTLEGRLAKAQRDLFARLTDTERNGFLAGLLADPLLQPRLLGLELVQSQVADGKSPPAEVITQVRGLLTDPDGAVRAAAVRTVAALRAEGEAERFATLLNSEAHPEVRRALVSGLGYVGSAANAPLLLEVLASRDEAAAGEAAAALAKLAERGQLEGASKPAISEELAKRYREIPPGQAAVRERLMWAMALMAESGFVSIFQDGMRPAEPPPIRQAAVRGLAELRDPQLAPLLIAAVSDPDASVRKAAVETLAELGASDEQIDALWSRLSPAREPDDGIRQSAWRGALRVLGVRPAAFVQTWLPKLPPDTPDLAQRTLDLLLLAERALQAESADRLTLGDWRTRIARQRATVGQLADAQVSYLAALEDLNEAQPAACPPLALEALRFGLRNDLYTPRFGTTLAGLSAGVAPADACAALREEVERRIAAEQVSAAADVLRAFQDAPPCEMAEPARATLSEIAQLLNGHRATTQPAELQNGSDAALGTVGKPKG